MIACFVTRCLPIPTGFVVVLSERFAPTPYFISQYSYHAPYSPRTGHRLLALKIHSTLSVGAGSLVPYRDQCHIFAKVQQLTDSISFHLSQNNRDLFFLSKSTRDQHDGVSGHWSSNFLNHWKKPSTGIIGTRIPRFAPALPSPIDAVSLPMVRCSLTAPSFYVARLLRINPLLDRGSMRSL
jgi:hypothetical protein